MTYFNALLIGKRKFEDPRMSTGLSWYNTEKHTPSDSQEVLVFVNGNFYATRFDLQAKRFFLKDESETFFDTSEHSIYWTEFLNE